MLLKLSLRKQRYPSFNYPPSTTRSWLYHKLTRWIRLLVGRCVQLSSWLCEEVVANPIYDLKGSPKRYCHSCWKGCRKCYIQKWSSRDVAAFISRKRKTNSYNQGANSEEDDVFHLVLLELINEHKPAGRTYSWGLLTVNDIIQKANSSKIVIEIESDHL